MKKSVQKCPVEMFLSGRLSTVIRENISEPGLYYFSLGKEAESVLVHALVPLGAPCITNEKHDMISFCINRK